MNMKLIGIGRTAKVYEFDSNRVVKVFNNDYPFEAVKKEFTNSQELNKYQIPIPK